MRKPFKVVLEKTRRQFLVGGASLGAILGFTLNSHPGGAAEAAPPLDRDAQTTLATLVRRMFPLSKFNEAAFAGVAEVVAAEAVASMPLSELIDNGVRDLNAAQDSDWVRANEQEQIAAMEAIQDQPFFQYVLHKSIDVLYRDQSLLALLGYEGSSVEKGGYLHRGFDDIDWLP